MRHHIYTLDDYDPEPDCGVAMVKVIPGTYEEQLASLEARLASIDRWIERMEPEGATGHSYARYSALCDRRANMAEHIELLDAIITAQTPDPEPPTDEELAQWRADEMAEWNAERMRGIQWGNEVTA